MRLSTWWRSWASSGRPGSARTWQEQPPRPVGRSRGTWKIHPSDSGERIDEGEGNHLYFGEINFTFICGERPFLIHLWRKGWPRVGARGPSLIRDLTWVFTDWLFISGTRQACLSRGVQLKSRPNRTNCLTINVWYVHIIIHAKYALNGCAWL